MTISISYKGIDIVNSSCYDVPEIWDILSYYPDYFDDSLHILTEAAFNIWFKLNVKDGLVGRQEGQIVGFGYLDAIHDNYASIGIITRRHSISPRITVGLFKHCLPYFFNKHNLKMIYASIKTSNVACMKLLDAVGFEITKVFQEDGQEKVYAGLIRENL